MNSIYSGVVYPVASLFSSIGLMIYGLSPVFHLNILVSLILSGIGGILFSIIIVDRICRYITRKRIAHKSIV